MRILVVNADDILVNTSANLCHLAYIRGLVELGYEVDLLCAKNNQTVDSSLSIPKGVSITRYDGVALYEKLSKSARNQALPVVSKTDAKSDVSTGKKSIKRSLFDKIKEFIRSYYGAYGFSLAFVRRAMKFKSNKEYDFVLSLSYPASSHLLAHKLLKHRRIKAKHWIQIWEDPWKTDLYSLGFNVQKEEEKLLSFADKVCYVSPLTLQNQKKLYQKYANKMFWQPLPAYYVNNEKKKNDDDKPIFGYFGDYFPFSRNLSPFYEAAVETESETYICGSPSDLFEQTNSVHIFPRMPLEQLKQYETKANILVFVCNLGGGQIPGKIYQYSATYKKVLFILDGNKEEKNVLFEYFSKFNRFYFCDNTAESIVEAMQNIKDNKNSDIVNEPVEYFAPENIVKEILGCVKDN